MAPPRRTVCDAGHDLTLPGATRITSKGVGKGRGRVCLLCLRQRRLEAKRRQRDEQRERHRLAREAFSQAHALPEEEQQDEDGATEAARNSPFAVTKRQLEQQWGVPYREWTLAQHQQHNIAMYRLLGWPDDGPVRMMPTKLPPTHAAVYA